MSKIKNFEGF